MSTTQRIAGLVSRFSHQAAQKVRRIQEQEATYQRSLKAELRREAAREAAEEQRRQSGITQRLPFARRGLAALIELGTSKEVQKLLKVIGDIGEPHIDFYSASRFTGFYWDESKETIAKMEEDGGVLVSEYDEDTNSSFSSLRSPYDEEQLSVVIMRDCLLFMSDTNSGGIRYNIYYLPKTDDGVTYQVHAEGARLPREDYLSLDQFLDQIASPDTVPMATIAHPQQRSYEWEAEKVFFQLLVSCGRKASFDRYLFEALSGLEAEQRDKRRRGW